MGGDASLNGTGDLGADRDQRPASTPDSTAELPAPAGNGANNKRRRRRRALSPRHMALIRPPRLAARRRRPRRRPVGSGAARGVRGRRPPAGRALPGPLRPGGCCSRAEGFLAGPDEHRLAELAAALADPEAKAVFAGPRRLRPAAPAAVPGSDAACAQRPKPIVGFSDATALLALAAARRAWPRCTARWSPSCPACPPRIAQALFGLLERPGPGLLLTDLEPLIPGRVQGPCWAATSRCSPACWARPFLPDLDRRGPVPRGHRRAPLPHRSPDHPPRSGGRVQRRLGGGGGRVHGLPRSARARSWPRPRSRRCSRNASAAWPSRSSSAPGSATATATWPCPTAPWSSSTPATARWSPSRAPF